MKLRSWVVPVAAGVCLFAPASVAAERFPDQASPELTAAFIFNFARYTEWPESSLGDTGRPFRVLVLGDDRIARAIDHLETGRIHGREVRAHSLPFADGDELGRSLREQLDDARVVFVGSSYRGKASTVLNLIDRKDVLTIGCFPGFAREGGMLNLEVRQDRMRFEANPESIHRSTLRISSEVLDLATIVHGERAEEGRR